MSKGQDVLAHLDPALRREWLLANGLGGSASGTAVGAHTRRGHALLVASSANGRMLTALLKLSERLNVAGTYFDLASTFTPEGLSAAGRERIVDFHERPWPTWRLRVDDVEIEKTVFLIHGHNAVAIAYRHVAGQSARLGVSPVLVNRGPDEIQSQSDAAPTTLSGVPGRVRIEVAGRATALTLWHSGTFMPAHVWERGMIYPLDGPAPVRSGARAARTPAAAKRRAAPAPSTPYATEDALIPGHIEVMLEPGGALHLVVATEDDLFRTLAVEGRLGTPPPVTLAACVAALERAERARRDAWGRSTLAGADFTARQAAAAHGGSGASTARRVQPLLDERDPWLTRLTAAVGAGLARRGHRLTLVSSLPRAQELGSDALRAVPGLVAVRAFGEAREIVRGYLEYVHEGMAPERFDTEDGHPHYGDPLVALWLVHAAELISRRTEDLDSVRDDLYPALEGIMQAYRAGTHEGIRVGDDGLLASGTERRADVNTLWFHALVAMAQLARLIGRKESAAFYLAWAREHQTCFVGHFWDEGAGRLHDVIDAGGPRGGVRAAHVLAASLSPPLLPPEQATRLVAKLERELFTPLGLLDAPGASFVSPAWLGPFATAVMRARGRGPETQAEVRSWFDTLGAHIRRSGFDQVPERIVVDASAKDSPAGGDPMSIVASAELLRVWVEELDHAEEPAAVG